MTSTASIVANQQWREQEGLEPGPAGQYGWQPHARSRQPARPHRPHASARHGRRRRGGVVELLRGSGCSPRYLTRTRRSRRAFNRASGVRVGRPATRRLVPDPHPRHRRRGRRGRGRWSAASRRSCPCSRRSWGSPTTGIAATTPCLPRSSTPTSRSAATSGSTRSSTTWHAAIPRRRRASSCRWRRSRRPRRSACGSWEASLPGSAPQGGVRRARLGWVSWWLYIVDDLTTRQGYEFPAISELPSHYFRQNVFLTFIDEPDAMHHARERLGVENIMWSSDYPHPVSSWPNSRSIVEEMFAGVPDPRARAGRQRQRRPDWGRAAHGSGPDHDGGAAMTDGGILGDLDVLDLSWGIAGPMTGMLLDHGARHWHRAAWRSFAGVSGTRLRGKRRATLDLRDVADRDVLLELAPMSCRDRASGRVLRNGWGSTIPRSSPPTHGSCTARSRVTASRASTRAVRPTTRSRRSDRSAVRESRGRRPSAAVGAEVPAAAPEGCTIGAASGPVQRHPVDHLATFYNARRDQRRASWRARSRGRVSTSTRRCCRRVATTVGGVATPSGPTAKASTRGSSTARTEGLPGAPTGSGRTTGYRSRRSSSTPASSTASSSTRPGWRQPRPCASRPRSRT